MPATNASSGIGGGRFESWVGFLNISGHVGLNLAWPSLPPGPGRRALLPPPFHPVRFVGLCMVAPPGAAGAAGPLAPPGAAAIGRLTPHEG